MHLPDHAFEQEKPLCPRQARRDSLKQEAYTDYVRRCQRQAQKDAADESVRATHRALRRRAG